MEEEDSGEQAVSRQSHQHTGPLLRCCPFRQVAGLAGLEGRLRGLSWPPVNPQGQTCTVQPVGRKFSSWR